VEDEFRFEFEVLLSVEGVCLEMDCADDDDDDEFEKAGGCAGGGGLSDPGDCVFVLPCPETMNAGVKLDALTESEGDAVDPEDELEVLCGEGTGN
jgi:hypothetical protein